MKWLIFITLLVTSLTRSWLHNQAPTSPGSTALCVVLALDDSGSMKTNDPGFVRYTAARLFLSLLDDGDAAAVVRFSDRAIPYTPMLVVLQRANEKTTLIEQIQPSEPGGYTDFLVPLNAAGQYFQEGYCTSRAVILLSDGKAELPSGLPADYSTQALELAASLDASIWSIALTPSGESGLLYQLAATTGGQVVSAHTADDLLDAYVSVLARIKDRTVIHVLPQAGTNRAVFQIDPAFAPYIQRMTVVILDRGLAGAQVIGPGGESLGEEDHRMVFIQHDPNFIAYAMNNPPPGEWAVQSGGQKPPVVRVIVRSKIRVRIDNPYALHPLGEVLTIRARMIEEINGQDTTLIGESAFTVSIRRPDGSLDSLDQLYDDGTHGDAQSHDGVFTHQYGRTDLPGTYQVHLRGYKGVLPVDNTFSIDILPFPRLSIIAPLEQSLQLSGEPIMLAAQLQAPYQPDLTLEQLGVDVISPSGDIHSQLLKRQDDTWSAEYDPQQNGRFQFRFYTSGASYKGVPYGWSEQIEVAVQVLTTIQPAIAELNAGLHETARLREGIHLTVPLRITGTEGVPVNVNITGIPDSVTVRSAPGWLRPGETNLYLTLSGEAAPGKYQGLLYLSSPVQTAWAVEPLPFTIEFFTPALTVFPAQITWGEIRQDQLNRQPKHILTVTSQSMVEEPVAIIVLGPQGLRVSPADYLQPPGQPAWIEVSLPPDGLEPGSYRWDLEFHSRDGVEVTPATTVVTVTVLPVPLHVRAVPWLLAGGAGLLSAWVMIKQVIRVRPKPWGILRPVRVPAGADMVGDAALTSLAGGLWKPGVMIGRGQNCQIRLHGKQILPHHARIRSDKMTVMEPLGRPPRMTPVLKNHNRIENLGSGLVMVDHQRIVKGAPSAPLRSGARITIGEYEFIYQE